MHRERKIVDKVGKIIILERQNSASVALSVDADKAFDKVMEILKSIIYEWGGWWTSLWINFVSFVYIH